MTLTLRPPEALDLPPLYLLAQDQAPKFLDDFHGIDLDYAQGILNNPYTRVIDDHGYAAGVVWFDDIVDDCRAEMHVLVRPEYWRAVIKQDILPQSATWGFEACNVGKLVAFPMHTQKTALKVLRKYGFYEHKPWHKHTKQAGVKVDVIMFELRKSYWEKKRGIR